MTEDAVGADAPRPNWLFPATVAFLIIAVTCGGSSSSPISVAVVRVAAAPLLALAILHLTRNDWDRGALWPLALAAAASLYVLVQLIPLPPIIWTALPGRSLYVRTYAAAGIPLPWLPLDLSPWSGWGALLGFLPPAAMLAAMPTLEVSERRVLSYLILALALASAALGMAQIATGQGSPLRFYAVTNPTSAVGFFANRNHEAAFLASTLPLAGYLAVRNLGRGGGRAVFWLAAAGAYAFVVALGAAASGSRAGVILAVLGGVGAIVVAARAWVRRPGPGWRMAALAWPALLLCLVFGLGALSVEPTLANSLQAKLGGDLRFSLTPVTIHAGETYAPLGAGAGSFVDVYPMYEPLTEMGPAYINHAHDDLAEVWLEAGIPGLALVIAFVGWWAMASAKAMSEPRRTGGALALAGSMTVGMLLAHSLVDYPLRTPALATYMAFAVGLITRPQTARRQGAS